MPSHTPEEQLKNANQITGPLVDPSVSTAADRRGTSSRARAGLIRDELTPEAEEESIFGELSFANIRKRIDDLTSEQAQGLVAFGAELLRTPTLGETTGAKIALGATKGFAVTAKLRKAKVDAATAKAKEAREVEAHQFKDAKNTREQKDFTQKHTSQGQLKGRSRFYTPASREEFTKLWNKGLKDEAENALVLNPKAIAGGGTTLENAFGKELGKLQAQEIGTRKTAAQAAAKTLFTMQNVSTTLSQGVITGQFANFKLGFGKLLSEVGINFAEDAVANTEKFMAAQGTATADLLASGAFGSGTGLSDNDLKFAEKIVAGDITLDEQGIFQILELNERMAQEVIRLYNLDIGENKEIAKVSKIPLAVKAPSKIRFRRPGGVRTTPAPGPVNITGRRLNELSVEEINALPLNEAIELRRRERQAQ